MKQGTKIFWSGILSGIMAMATAIQSAFVNATGTPATDTLILSSIVAFAFHASKEWRTALSGKGSNDSIAIDKLNNDMTALNKKVKLTSESFNRK